MLRCFPVKAPRNSSGESPALAADFTGRGPGWPVINTTEGRLARQRAEELFPSWPVPLPGVWPVSKTGKREVHASSLRTFVRVAKTPFTHVRATLSCLRRHLSKCTTWSENLFLFFDEAWDVKFEERKPAADRRHVRMKREKKQAVMDISVAGELIKLSQVIHKQCWCNQLLGNPLLYLNYCFFRNRVMSECKDYSGKNGNFITITSSTHEFVTFLKYFYKPKMSHCPQNA